MIYVPRRNLSQFITCLSTSTRITTIVTSCGTVDRDLKYNFLDWSMVVFRGTPARSCSVIHPRETDRGKPGIVYPYISSLYSLKCRLVALYILRLQISSTRVKSEIKHQFGMFETLVKQFVFLRYFVCST
jgi:hypothetical protein